MSRRRRTLIRVLSGTADQNIRFQELRTLLNDLGFRERTRGSHHIYYRDGIQEIINLQPRNGGHAKAYQVRQVRNIIVKYQLAEDVES